eukprot:2578749-Alexandrium_andersonii.AAC.1
MRAWRRSPAVAMRFGIRNEETVSPVGTLPFMTWIASTRAMELLACRCTWGSSRTKMRDYACVLTR